MANDFLEKIKDPRYVRDSLDGNLDKSIEYGVKQNPSQHYATTKAAKELNIPQDLAERQAEEVKRIAREKEIRRKIHDTTYVKKALEKPDFAALAHEDVEGLVKTENAIKAIRGPEASVYSVTSGLLKTLPQAAEVTRQNIRLQWADFIGSERMRKDAIRKLEIANTEIAISRPEFESEAAAGLYSGAESFVRQLPGLGASIATGSVAPSLMMMGQMTEAEAYGRYRTRGGTAKEAFLGGMAEGGIEVITELWPMKYVVDRLGGKTAFTKFVAGWVGRDAFTEQIATLTQDAVDTAIANPDKTWGEYFKERPSAAYQTLMATIMQGGIMGATHYVASRYADNAYKAEKTFEDQQTLDTAVESVKDIKLRTTAPEVFKEFLDEQLGADNSVFLDPEDADVFFQSHPEILEKMPAESAEAIRDSMGLGADVIIPKSDYLTYFTEYHDELSPKIRNDQDGLTIEEANQFVEEGQDSFEKEAESILLEQERQVEFDRSAEQVKEEVKQRILQTGRFKEDVAEKYAVLHQAFAKTVAQKTGKLPYEVYFEVGPDVKGAPIAGGKLNQPIKIDDVQSGSRFIVSTGEGDIEVTVIKRDGALALSSDAGISEINAEHAATFSSIQDVFNYQYEPFGGVTEIKLDQDQRTKPRQKPVLQQEDEVWVYKEGEEGEREAHRGFIVDVGSKESIVSIDDQWETIPNAQLDLVEQKLYQKEKGFYQPDQNIIGLLEDADLSTFLHETGHFFLESISRMPEFRREMEQTLKWMKLDRETWDGMDLEQKREYHEQFARGFEAYLMEGKAPSLELQSVFQRFRDWLVNIYKSLRNLNVNLTKEVRQVFDRLLATDEQIREAEAARAYEPLFASYEESEATLKQWSAYQRLDQERRQKSREELQSRSLKDMKWMSNAKARVLKEIQREVKGKRASLREEVAKDVSRETVYRAIQFFRRGEIEVDGEIVTHENHRLDIDLLNEMFPYGEDIDIPDWKALGHGKFGMLGKDGLDPEETAIQFGYKSADAMIRDILEAPNQKEYIDAVTDQRMLETYGDISNPVEMERAAEEAIHNDVHTRFLHTELRIISKGYGDKNVLAKAAKRYAEQAINNKKVRDIKPNQYLAAQSRAGNNALRAMAKGDRESAVDHKRAQVLNNHFYRAANNAQKDVEKMLRYLRKFQKEGTRKAIDPEYIEQIDALLTSFDYKNRSLKEIDKNKTLAQFINQQEEDNDFQPIIDEALIERTKLKNYKDMTYAEFRGHVDTIEHIEHLGRLKKKLLTSRSKKEFNKIMDEARLSLQLMANRIVKRRATSSDVLGKTGKVAREYGAMHRKMASIIREMDGHKDGGIMWNLFLRPMNESGDNEIEMNLDVTKAFGEIFSKLKIRTGVGGMNIRTPKYVIPGTDISLTDEQRIMVALNWGNAGNRQRLMDGGLIEKTQVSEQEVQAILDTLTAQELEVVQEIFDYIASYRPQVAEQEKRLTGKTPEWVEPVEIVAKNGTIKGGYLPAKYDVQLSESAAQYEAVADSRNSMKGIFGAATTQHSHVESRAKEVKGKGLLLSFDVLSNHMNQVVHRLAWQDWIIDANRILKALEPDIRKYYGPEIYKELREGVKDIAIGDAPARNSLEVIFNRLRVGATIVGMAYRVTTAAIQPTGLAQSWVRIGRPWLAKGLKVYLNNPIEASRVASEKSKLMRDRDQTQMREMNEVLTKVRSNNQLSWVKAHAFWLIAKIQRTVDVPTWWGAYEKAMAELQIETAVDQAERDKIDAKAVQMANQAVIDSQSGGQIKDLARVQRGNPYWKTLTNFYSFFSATWNLNVEAFRKMQLHKSQDPAKAYLGFTGDLIAINIVPAILGMLIREGLKNECEGDLECLAKKAIEEEVDFITGQTIFTREMAPAIRALVGGRNFGYQGPPGLRPFAEFYKLGAQTAQGEFDDAWRRAFLNSAGSVFHLPTGQLNTMIDGFQAIESGDVQGTHSVLAPLAGPSRK